jgi:hypothetical protein
MTNLHYYINIINFVNKKLEKFTCNRLHRTIIFLIYLINNQNKTVIIREFS